jgi:hypothetical protein
LESTAREEIAEEEIVDSEVDDIDPGIAAVELQTPINEDSEEMVDQPINESETE